MENLTNQTQQNNTLPVVLRTRSSVDTGPDTEFEKSINRTQPPQDPEANQTRDIPKTDAQDQPSNPNNNARSTRQKWTKEEYKEVLYAYYHTTLNQEISTSQKETFYIWRQRNPNNRPNMDSNKLGAVRRDITKNKRLTDNEINKIIKSVKDELSVSHPHLYREPTVPEEQNLIDQHQSSDLLEPGIQEPNTNVNTENSTRNDPAPRENSNNEISNNQNDELVDEILEQYLINSHQDLNERTTLPKINNNNKNKKIIANINKSVEQLIPTILINADNRLTALNNLQYAAAYR